MSCKTYAVFSNYNWGLIELLCFFKSNKAITFILETWNKMKAEENVMRKVLFMGVEEWKRKERSKNKSMWERKYLGRKKREDVLGKGENTTMTNNRVK